MTRNLSGTQTTGATSEKSDAIFLIELTYWDGAAEQVVRLTTAGDDINADPDGTGAVTFDAAAGLLRWSQVEEGSDRRAQGVTVEMSGVDQTIISTINNNSFRGRQARIWKADLSSDQANVSDTLLLFRGKQLGDYEVEEDVSDDDSPNTATVRTRVMSRLAEFQQKRAVRTNTENHDEMLARAGLSTGDTLFMNVPGLAGKRIFWGTEQPDEGTKTFGPGGQGPGNGGEPGDGPERPFF